jgi:CTP synthase
MTRLRFRHRYEVNPAFIEPLQESGLIFSGTNPSGEIMQILEMKDHPYFFGTQAHPELTSRLENPNAFFLEFMRAAEKTIPSRKESLASNEFNASARI